MNDDLKGPSDALLQHMEGLYTFAQTVTLDAAAAAELVEATYRRAYATPPEVRPPLDHKAWLYSLLMEVRAEWQTDPPDPAADLLDPSDLRQRMAEQLLDRRLPVALATLPEDLRLLLLLCEVDRFSCSDAGRVLDLDAEAACARLDQARTALQDALQANTTGVERQLLDATLPADWMRAALERFTASAFTLLPPTLRSTVATALKQQPEHRQSAPVPSHAPPAPAAWRKAGLSLPRALGALLLIVLAGLLGFLLSEFSEQEPDRNLITLSVRQADVVKPTFHTGSPEQAERFILDRLGWRLSVPTIEGASLLGVGINELAPGVEAPAFLFEDATTGQPITLFTYSYAFLDRHEDRVRLDVDVLNQIEEEQHFDLHDLDEEKVLIWRNRDDIYVAVTRANADSLSERIYFPS